MLSWSARKTGREIDIAAIRSQGRDPRIEAGRELVALGHAATGAATDASHVEATAAVLGDQAGVKAAAVAGGFEIFNRVVDAVGLPVGRNFRERMSPVVDTLRLAGFPHAGH